MRGVVLAELVDFVSATYGDARVDAVLGQCDLSTGGAYTRVGHYPAHEFHAIIAALGRDVQASPSELARAFGRYLFRRLVLLFPEALLAGTALDMLRGLDATIHATVARLYPDAELPRFRYPESAANELRLVYESKRAMADLAHGLIEGCIHLFRESLVIERHDHSVDGSCVEFILRPAPTERGP
jgi:hypothetical protein